MYVITELKCICNIREVADDKVENEGLEGPGRRGRGLPEQPYPVDEFTI